MWTTSFQKVQSAVDFSRDDLCAIYNELYVTSVKDYIDSRFVELVHNLRPNIEKSIEPADGLVLYSKILEAIEL